MLRHPLASLTRALGALFNGHKDEKEAIVDGPPRDLGQPMASPARRDREETRASWDSDRIIIVDWGITHWAISFPIFCNSRPELNAPLWL